MRNFFILLLGVSLITAAQWRPENEDLRLVKKWKLTEFLDLSEDQAERFFPRVNELEKNLENLRHEKMILNQELNQMLEGDTIDDQRVNQIINNQSRLDKEAAELIRDHMQNIGDILTPVQKVKYTVFEERFKEMLQQKVRKEGGRHQRQRSENVQDRN